MEMQQTQVMVRENQKRNHISIIPIILFLFVAIINIIFLRKYEKICLIIQFLLIAGVFFAIVPQLSIKYVSYMLVILYCGIATILNNSGLGVIITFVTLIMILILGKETFLTRKEEHYLDISFLVFIFLIIVIYYKKDGMYYISRLNQEKMNPNSMATLILSFGFMLHNAVRNFYKEKRYILNAAVFVCILYLLKETGARTAMLSYVVFIALILVFPKLKMNNKAEENRRLTRMVLLACITNIVVVFVYIQLYYYIDGDELIVFGKNLFTGREAIWKEAIELYSNNFWWGISSKHIFCGQWENTHNGMLSILCHLTIFGLIAFCILYSSSVKCKSGEIINKYKAAAMIAFLIEATFENLIVDSTFFFVLIPFILNKRRIEVDE